MQVQSRDEPIEARDTFTKYFELKRSKEKVRLKIEKGTKGVLTERDPKTNSYQKVAFDFEGDVALAPIAYERRFAQRDDLVSLSLLFYAH